MQSRRDVQRAQTRWSRAKTIRNVLIVIIVVVLLLWGGFAIANHPKKVAEKQAVSLAKKYGHLKSTSAFYIYNRDQTYYTVAGKNKKKQKLLVLVSQKGNIRVEKQADGLTAAEAKAKVRADEKPKKILKVALGVFNDKVVWEVTYRNQKGNLCYDLINFKNGKYVQQINNL